jgi:hypothetical protein
MTYDPYAKTLNCPLCGYDYVHLGPVTVTQNHDAITIGMHADGHSTIEHGMVEASGYGRGAEITIRGKCEGGHNFRLTLWFHKGQTYTSIQQVATDEGELWRD